MKKQSMFNSFFARSWLTNLLACMLLIVAIAPLCLNFYNAFYDRQKENLQDSLKVMLEDLSSNLNSLNEMIGNEGKNKILAKLGFIQGSVPPSASWDILTAKAYISSVASNPYVADCVAVFSKNNLLLTRLTTPGGTITLSATIDNGMLADTQRLIYFYLLAAVLFILALSFYMTRRQFRPIHTILSQLQSFGYTLPEDQNHMEFVERSLADMQDQQKNITETLHVYRDQLQASQLERLLSGHPDASAIPAPEILLKPYRVAYAYLKDESADTEISLLGTLITQQLSKLLHHQAIVHQMENSAFAVILSADASLDELKNMIADFNLQLSQPMRMICSAPVEGIHLLHPTFEAVRAASLAAAALCHEHFPGSHAFQASGGHRRHLPGPEGTPGNEGNIPG